MLVVIGVVAVSIVLCIRGAVPLRTPTIKEQVRSASWPDVVKGDWTRLCLISVLSWLCFECVYVFRYGRFDDHRLFCVLFCILFFFVSGLVVNISASDWLERLVSEMTTSVLTRTLNPVTSSLTGIVGSRRRDASQRHVCWLTSKSSKRHHCDVMHVFNVVAQCTS